MIGAQGIRKSRHQSWGRIAVLDPEQIHVPVQPRGVRAGRYYVRWHVVQLPDSRCIRMGRYSSDRVRNRRGTWPHQRALLSQVS
jgi:hypothetical protein